MFDSSKELIQYLRIYTNLVGWEDWNPSQFFSVELSCFFNYLPVFLCSSPAWFPLHTSLVIPASFPMFLPVHQPDLCSRFLQSFPSPALLCVSPTAPHPLIRLVYVKVQSLFGCFWSPLLCCLPVSALQLKCSCGLFCEKVLQLIWKIKNFVLKDEYNKACVLNVQ